ncbi:hypothetical protein GEMRC1_006036 [Eukaryota sp. GEM-RC1]
MTYPKLVLSSNTPKVFFSSKWTRCYLQLRGVLLEFFSTDNITEPTLSLPVSGCTFSSITKSNQSCIIITYDEVPDIFFHTSSYKENLDWLAALQSSQALGKYLNLCDIEGCNSDPDVLKIFSSDLNNLTAFSLHNKSLPVNIYSALAVPLECSHLNSLTISHCSLTDEALSFLENPLSRITSLLDFDLSHNNLTEIGGNIIGRVLSRSHSIRKLLLGNNSLGDGGLEAIISGLSSHRVASTTGPVALQCLSVANNGISAQGVSLMVESMVVDSENGDVFVEVPIEQLDLSGNKFGDLGVSF